LGYKKRCLGKKKTNHRRAARFWERHLARNSGGVKVFAETKRRRGTNFSKKKKRRGKHEKKRNSDLLNSQ